MKIPLNQLNLFYTFVLQEAEGESINMQNQIDALKEEKERLLNSLVEAECVNHLDPLIHMPCCLNIVLPFFDKTLLFSLQMPAYLSARASSA